MGFLDQAGHANPVRITLLTPGFQAEGTLNIVGQAQTFLNDDTKAVFALTDATLFGLKQGNPARSVQVPELFVRKESCHAVMFSQMLSREESGLLPRGEPLAAYTDYFVVQGTFHMGTDTLLGDFFAVSRSTFVGVTDVSIFSLFQPQTTWNQHAPLVYVARELVHVHHKV